MLRGAHGRPAASPRGHQGLRAHPQGQRAEEISSREATWDGCVKSHTPTQAETSPPEGAWSLEISQNKLRSLPSLAFSGLERSLWHLSLSQNHFTRCSKETKIVFRSFFRIPSDSISRLKKLNKLDLSGDYFLNLNPVSLSLTTSRKFHIHLMKTGPQRPF